MTKCLPCGEGLTVFLVRDINQGHTAPSTGCCDPLFLRSTQENVTKDTGCAPELGGPSRVCRQEGNSGLKGSQCGWEDEVRMFQSRRVGVEQGRSWRPRAGLYLKDSNALCPWGGTGHGAQSGHLLVVPLCLYQCLWPLTSTLLVSFSAAKFWEFTK